MVTKKTIKFVFYLQVIIILFFWWSGSGELLGTSTVGTLLAVGRLAGLFSVFFVLMQFALIGRITFIERAFGLDSLARIHRRQGKYAMTLILLHAALMITSYALAHEVSVAAQLTEFVTTEPELLKSFLALCIFLLTVGLSLYIVFKHLKYEFWYYVHLLNYLAVLLAFGHQMKLGGDFAQNAFVIYWWAFYIIILGGFVIFRWVRPLALFFNHQFVVQEVVPETAQATSVIISGRHLENFKRESGQFMIVRFLDKRRFWQAHPFSLSWSANNKNLRATIKNSGDFTSEISTLKVGTRVIVDGMYGVFTEKRMHKKKILFIAGGVGITPIRSLLEDVAKSRDVLLLYSNKVLSDIIFKQELDTLAHTNNFIVHHILTEEEGYKGESGRLDEEKIKRLVPDFINREVYLCGPDGFMDAMIAILMKFGIKKEFIHFEKFSLH
jgi:predicted ferric reductase